MFQDLNWRYAARRAAIVIAVYVVLFYVLSIAAPRTFPLSPVLLINALMFFFVFTFVYAFVERSRNRRIAEAKKKESSKPARDGEDPDTPSALKGRPNPNTSRKKSRRKR